MVRDLVVLAAVAGFGVVGAASPSDAGKGDAAPLTVVKVVEGVAPPGTQFVVEFQCENDRNTLDQVVFDEFGDPIGPDTTFFVEVDQCLVVETETGGATTVAYECEGTIPPPNGQQPGGESFESPAPQGPPITDPCDQAGPTADPISVVIVESNQEATVTVTNTFVEPPPPPPEPAPVTVEPTFTG